MNVYVDFIKNVNRLREVVGTLYMAVCGSEARAGGGGDVFKQRVEKGEGRRCILPFYFFFLYLFFNHPFIFFPFLYFFLPASSLQPPLPFRQGSILLGAAPATIQTARPVRQVQSQRRLTYKCLKQYHQNCKTNSAPLLKKGKRMWRVGC